MLWSYLFIVSLENFPIICRLHHHKFKSLCGIEPWGFFSVPRGLVFYDHIWSTRHNNILHSVVVRLAVELSLLAWVTWICRGRGSNRASAYLKCSNKMRPPPPKKKNIIKYNKISVFNINSVLPLYVGPEKDWPRGVCARRCPGHLSCSSGWPVSGYRSGWRWPILLYHYRTCGSRGSGSTSSLHKWKRNIF